jgi:hypothetical protein
MDSELQSRLSSFLPALKAANEDLQGNIAAGRGGDIVMDNADEEKEPQYIEMVRGPFLVSRACQMANIVP